jgi:hypothetical protein
MHIVGKYKMYLQSFRKQVEKLVFGKFFLACFAASANQFYIYRQWQSLSTVFILQS